MRACPAREGCLARDSMRRSCALRSTSSDSRAPMTYHHMPDGKLFQLDDSAMTVRSLIARITQQENLNFLLTNRVPRRALTLLVGRLSRWEQPLLSRALIAVWRLFTELDLSEARATRFRRLHECFARALRGSARGGS